MSVLSTFTYKCKVKKCCKCDIPFLFNEEIVHGRQNKGPRGSRTYHKHCYVDAKGVPFYE